MSQRSSGSEKFHNRPKKNEELRKIMPESLRTISYDKSKKLNPVTYEVLRHSIWQLTNEMGETIKRTSGSVIVSESNDFNFALTNEFGDEVQIGIFSTSLSASIDMAIKWSLEHRSANPGILKGDMFLCNDPWVGGGVHQNDVAVFAPFFWEDELFAWTGAVAHQIDVGGVGQGSWTPQSENVFWESLPIPPVKIVEGNQIRKDMEDMYLRRSRVPSMVALDLRAKIAANNVGQDRLLRLIKRYGVETVKLGMEQIMNHAEIALRQRLLSLPDGTWKSTAYQETARFSDRKIYKIALTMTKAKDRLTFDFTGTSKQALGMINCTFVGIRGGIMGVVLPVLCADIPWSPGGIIRCFDVVSEEGTLNNCLFPAGIAKASVASGWSTRNAVTECVSNMLGTSGDPVMRSRRIAVSCGTFDLVVMSGSDQRKRPYIAMLMDVVASGMGAREGSDGVDTGGVLGNSRGQIPDVETNEFNYPILYLWRREEADTGGAGKFRGGVSSGSCFILHNTESTNLLISNSGTALPQATGLDGGYPGATMTNIVIKDSIIREQLARGFIPAKIEEIEGSKLDLGPAYQGRLGVNDVFLTRTQGGGGIGDPLLRDPKAVLKDVLTGKVTHKAARKIYCISIDERGNLNEVETTKLRQERLDARRKPDHSH